MSAGFREADDSTNTWWTDATWEGDNLVLDMRKGKGADVFVRFKPKAVGIYACLLYTSLREHNAFGTGEQPDIDVEAKLGGKEDKGKEREG